MEKKLYEQIDAMKGVAIFLVVLGHSIIMYPIDILHNSEVWYGLFRWLSSVHMPLFFMISGYCFSYKKGALIHALIIHFLINYIYFFQSPWILQ